jgi:hypothetical protein
MRTVTVEGSRMFDHIPPPVLGLALFASLLGQYALGKYLVFVAAVSF